MAYKYIDDFSPNGSSSETLLRFQNVPEVINVFHFPPTPPLTPPYAALSPK